MRYTPRGVRHDRSSRFRSRRRTLLAPTSVSMMLTIILFSSGYYHHGSADGSFYDKEHNRHGEGPDDRRLRTCPIALSRMQHHAPLSLTNQALKCGGGGAWTEIGWRTRGGHTVQRLRTSNKSRWRVPTGWVGLVSAAFYIDGTRPVGFKVQSISGIWRRIAHSREACALRARLAKCKEQNSIPPHAHRCHPTSNATTRKTRDRSSSRRESVLAGSPLPPTDRGHQEIFDMGHATLWQLSSPA